MDLLKYIATAFDLASNIYSWLCTSKCKSHMIHGGNCIYHTSFIVDKIKSEQQKHYEVCMVLPYLAACGTSLYIGWSWLGSLSLSREPLGVYISQPFSIG